MRKYVIGCLLGLLVLFPAFGKSKVPPKKASADSKATEILTSPMGVEIPGKMLFSTARMIRFDVHPLTTTYLDSNPAVVAGKNVSLQVETLESWSSEDAPRLEKLGFRVLILAGGQMWKTLEIPPSSLGKNIAKGMVLGSAKTEELGFNFVVEEVQKEGTALTGLTYVLSMVALTADAREPAAPVAGSLSETASATVAPGSSMSPGTVPALVKKLLEKAKEMPAGKEKARVAMLKKALLLAKAVANPSAETEALIADLEAQTKSEGKIEKPFNSQVVNTSGPVQEKPADKTSQAVLDLYHQAQKSFAFGQEPEARELLRQAVEKDPAFFDGWSQIGKNALKNSKYAKAQEAFQKALAVRRDDLESAVGFFKASYYLGDAEAGLVVLRELVQNSPQRLLARQALAEAYFQAGDDENCSEECRQILSQDSGQNAAKELLEKCTRRMK